MKPLIVFAAAALAVGSFGLVSAQDQMGMAKKSEVEMGMPAHDMMKMGKEEMDSRMMCGMMMSKSIVATSDGGVVVVVGNKLLKYDSNLELKKEVEIPVDMEAMRQMMTKMKEQCPMGKMMGQANVAKECMRPAEQQPAKSR